MSSVPATALSALGAAMNVIAHNTANACTDGFEKNRVLFHEARSGGVTVSIEGNSGKRARTYPDRTIETETGSSNVNLHEECARLITTLHAYEAVIATARAEDETKHALMDIIA